MKINSLINCAVSLWCLGAKVNNLCGGQLLFKQQNAYKLTNVCKHLRKLLPPQKVHLTPQSTPAYLVLICILFGHGLSNVLQCKNDEEVVAVIAHELGHWKLNHTVYSFIAVQVRVIAFFY